jgi:peroxiredoxin
MKKQILFSTLIATALVSNSSMLQGTLLANAEQASPSLTPSAVDIQSHAYEFLDLIPVGHSAPDFTAQTALKKPFHLGSLKGHKNAVIVFYQGSFCPVCGKQLENLQANLDAFKALDTEIIAISADDTSHAMQSIGEHGLQFTVIPDSTKTLIKKYGVSNVGKEGIAWPALYIIDKSGKVRLSFAKEDGHRMHSEEILPLLKQINSKK